MSGGAIRSKGTAQAIRIKSSAIVFCGGACYGILASVVKIAYGAGFSFQQVVCSQAVFAFLIFLLLAAYDKLRGHTRPALTAKQRLKLAAMGIVTALTTTFYYLSLTFVPASVGITLLFQFTWMGLIFEVATTRKRPTTASLLAAAIIFLGTLLASGLLGSTGLGSLDIRGVICGILAAFCCASFMFLSGHVETELSASQRGLWACSGYMLVGLLLCPNYFTSGVLAEGIWHFGVILGPLGFALPMILFGIGCKHLSPGLSTIMASSELPISILCSIVILKEVVSMLQISGVIAILAGVVIAQIPSLRQNR